MKVLGRASASQVIAAFRYDLMLRSSGVKWPEPLDEPDPDRLTLLRVNALINAGRPVSFALEVAWDLCELTAGELRNQVYPMGRSTTFEAYTAAVVEGREILTVEAQEHLGNMREKARTNTLEFGIPVAVIAGNNGAADYTNPHLRLMLIEGHHRVLASIMEHRVPDSIKILVGVRPVSLGMSILNGTMWPYDVL